MGHLFQVALTGWWQPVQQIHPGGRRLRTMPVTSQQSESASALNPSRRWPVRAGSGASKKGRRKAPGDVRHRKFIIGLGLPTRRRRGREVSVIARAAQRLQRRLRKRVKTDSELE